MVKNLLKCWSVWRPQWKAPFDQLLTFCNKQKSNFRLGKWKDNLEENPSLPVQIQMYRTKKNKTKQIPFDSYTTHQVKFFSWNIIVPSKFPHLAQKGCLHKPYHTEELPETILLLTSHGICDIWSTLEGCILSFLKGKKTKRLKVFPHCSSPPSRAKWNS